MDLVDKWVFKSVVAILKFTTCCNYSNTYNRRSIVFTDPTSSIGMPMP